ncbi:type II toxin-antitoxin system PemK/MazF family toxin [Pseudomonas batumici]|uniref:type II toxin-antitoxin system PemK/MazF family toxin n=1 Tax=Pseudomonas batumici TaxID=226910 RepID=UPI000A05D456|nr:type II toxin-antitoxin system PemK/MazF family toxin [Pseudomonas batumici]
MALTYSPKVGEILECDFGDYRNPPLDPSYDGLIPNEMRKRRMVVVINGKLPNGCCLIVPVSSSGNRNCIDRGFHVPIPAALITSTRFYDRRDRWAVIECVTHVSKDRLFKIKNQGAPVSDVMPRDVVAKIQRAMIKTLNAAVLLIPETTPETSAVDLVSEGC